jgi:hypothetical protein
MLCLSLFFLGDYDHHQDIHLKAFKTLPKYEEQKHHSCVLDMYRQSHLLVKHVELMLSDIYNGHYKMPAALS